MSHFSPLSGGQILMLSQRQPEPQQHRELVSIIVPPRVQWAMNVIALFTKKTEAQVAMGGGEFGSSNVEKIPGQTLTEPEVLVHSAACDLLADYFAGRFKPDIWEEPVSRRVKNRSKGRKRDRIIHAVNCPGCGGVGGGCKMCGGDETMLLIRRSQL